MLRNEGEKKGCKMQVRKNSAERVAFIAVEERSEKRIALSEIGFWL